MSEQSLQQRITAVLRDHIRQTMKAARESLLAGATDEQEVALGELIETMSVRDLFGLEPEPERTPSEKALEVYDRKQNAPTKPKATTNAAAKKKKATNKPPETKPSKPAAPQKPSAATAKRAADIGLWIEAQKLTTFKTTAVMKAFGTSRQSITRALLCVPGVVKVGDGAGAHYEVEKQS